MHEHSVVSESRLGWKRVQNCKKALQDFVVHCEDHNPNHLMAFCPQFYFASVSRTWNDPLVFRQLETDLALRDRVFAQIPKQIRQRYPWGVDCSGSLPVGFVLLKRKKMFRKGRTIVSYLHAPLRRLLAAAAYAIQLMLSSVWDGLDLSMPAIWRQTHQYLQDMPSSVGLLEFNDDLVGFFNSVPREMIVSALELLIREYYQHTGVSIFTVDLRKSTASVQRALPHKPRGGRSKQLHTLELKHLVSIVQLSFCSGVFVANHKCFQQIRGTCIRNQISTSGLCRGFYTQAFTERPKSWKKFPTIPSWDSECAREVDLWCISNQWRCGRFDTTTALDPCVGVTLSTCIDGAKPKAASINARTVTSTTAVTSTDPGAELMLKQAEITLLDEDTMYALLQQDSLASPLSYHWKLPPSNLIKSALGRAAWLSYQV